MKNFKLVLASMALAASALPMSAHAYIFGFSDLDSRNQLVLDGGAVSLVNIDSGWYREDFMYSHSPDNKNYIAGLCQSCDAAGVNYNNFFVFDISSLKSPVQSASFSVFSFDADETLVYSLRDFAGSIDELRTSGGSEAIYNDLADGVEFGQIGVGPGNQQQLLSVSLNGAFLGKLNAAIAAGQTQFAFGGTTSPVPEPETLGLLLAGLAVTGGAMRARRRQA